MRRVDGTGRPTVRLLSAILLMLLAVTGVHGAGSAAVPAGAIATEHASVGAAFLHFTSSEGRADQQVLVVTEQLEDPDATDGASPALPASAAVPPSLDGSGVRVERLVSSASSRINHGQQGRAPPA